MSLIPYHDELPDFWGPSEDEICQTAAHASTASVDPPLSHDSAACLVDDNYSDTSAMDDIASNIDQYCDLIDLVEVTELADAYHTMDNDTSAFKLDNLQTQSHSSPSKRSRHHVDYS